MPTLAEHREDEFILLRCSGRITVAGVAGFHQEIDQSIAGSDKNIVLDLADVTYIDSMGIGELATAYRKLQEQGRGLTIVNVPRPIRDLLSIVRLDTVFEIYRDVDEAATAMKSRQALSRRPV